MRETVPVINANFFSEPTPDGLYDYKLVLPTGPINGIRISVAEVQRHDARGLHATQEEGKCMKKQARQVREAQGQEDATFLVHRSRTCPPSGQLSFAGVLRLRRPTPDRDCKTIADSLPEVRLASRCRSGSTASQWVEKRGRMRSSQAGTAQVRSPNSRISAGSRIRRTTVASSTTATVRPMPNWRVFATGETANARNTTAMMKAAPVMIVAVFSRL